MFVAGVVALTLGGSARTQEAVYRPGKGVTDPVLTHEVKPLYTDAAKSRKIQGAVELSAVVLKDGTVGETHITRSLDADLDREAEKAAKQWRFKPGTKDGEPVNVQVTIELTFTLRDGQIYRPGFGGVTFPKALKTVTADYDDDARRERVQGSVELEGVVETDGTVTGIHVTRSLDERLDRQAIKAFGQWRFTPAQKNGAAVRAFVRVEMTFNLK
jgi:TonB family protein